MKTVKDLIEELSKFPPDMPVVCGANWSREYFPVEVTSVRLITEDGEFLIGDERHGETIPAIEIAPLV